LQQTECRNRYENLTVSLNQTLKGLVRMQNNAILLTLEKRYFIKMFFILTCSKFVTVK
jgi:hypothetical protein